MEKKLRDKLPNGEFQEVDPRHTKLMKAVRGKGNRTTEAKFEGALNCAGIDGFSLNEREVLGKPDFFFPNERLAIFIDGCFWHGCIRCGHIPKKNRSFWQAKIERNRERDISYSAKLRRQGISVLRFWEHEVALSLPKCISRTRERLARRKYKRK